MTHAAHDGERGWAALAVVLWMAAPLAAGEAVRKTRSWPNTPKGFDEFGELIRSQHGRNLLARPGVKIDARNVSDAYMLADGDAGERCGEGRSFVNGAPSVITVYLGRLKPIHQVGAFTFNGDARANQDFEVRFADNSGKPGKKPKFPTQPHLTTGKKILGANRGGYHTWFAAEDGQALSGRKADWVELRIWRTYNVQAGRPARTRHANSASAYVELQVFGDADDVVTPTKEQLARRKVLREAPKRPDYQKKATWQATMRAAREAILRWECKLDRLRLPDSGFDFGPWHAIGPVKERSKLARQLDGMRKLDLTQPVAVQGAPPVAWRKIDGVADGEMVDVAAALNGKCGPGDVIYLARDLEATTTSSRRDPFSIGVGFARGRITLLPTRSAVAAPREGEPVVPNQRNWAMSVTPGKYQVIARLTVGDGGACGLWFMPHPTAVRPGAGPERARVARRDALFGQLRKDFPDPLSQMQISWEQADGIWIQVKKGQMARRDKLSRDWVRGNPAFLVSSYNAAASARAEAIQGQPATAEVRRWLATFRTVAPTTIASARRRYYAAATVQEALADARRIEAMRLAVEDQCRTFGRAYPKGAEYLARVAALGKRLATVWSDLPSAPAALLGVRKQLDADSREILLANPLLRDMGKLLLIRGGPGFSSNWGGPNRLGNEIVVLSPVQPDGKITTIYKGSRISDMDLRFDAKKILFSDGRYLHEIDADPGAPGGIRQISKQTEPKVAHYDACYLPNGQIMFISTACEQAVPCTGGWGVGNLHVMDADGQNERRLTYDQDHDWNPCVLNSGRVIYTRWEYTETPHYFTRLLFHMNPDGTRQMEYYGSNSYWPNALYWARPIPGHPTKIVSIVSGHHGVGRVGEMVIFDPARGRHEADGVVQRIGDRGKVVEPVIKDGLVKDVWPRFATPYPLAEPGTNRGAGKYFLATVKMDAQAPWGLYLVDVFDNMTPLLMGGYSQPFALRPRKRPPVVPTQFTPGRKDALVYMVDVYKGGGLKGYPRGSIKALRLGSHHYRFGGNGDTRAASIDGGWDVKIILGTVPVHADGSAYFRVPANTPIFVQPLTADGRAQQQMRSWFVAMPGEVLSCVGCHERQNDTPPNALTLASARPPAEIRPWFGPARGFSFDREVQPVLDARCAGCHNGQPRKDGRRIPDFRAKRLHKDYKGSYSPAYIALHPYVRRAGYEADYHLQVPAEFEATTGQLVQMLKKGHNNVQLTDEQWRRLYTWIDFNVPYPANWRESHRPPQDDQVARRVKYKGLYASVADKIEESLPLPPLGKFQPPAAAEPPPAAPKLDGWPLTADQAKKRQKATGLTEMTLDLGGGVTMAFMPLPPGRFVMGDAAGFPDEYPQAVVDVDGPFYMGRLEVTNEQYARFDPTHDSAYIDARGKDRYTRGYPANEPKQPVIRITWRDAMSFCQWLSPKAGPGAPGCTLPTEAQWEYACRAGTSTPWHFGRADVDANGKKRTLNNVGNFADRSLGGWAWGRVEPGYSDADRFSGPGGKYPPNAWGLCDMHGNVAEWTRSTYRPYPYAATDGRDNPAAGVLKVVRGGSWNDKLKFGRSASRWRYPRHQPVYNVGFRVVVTPDRVAKK